MNPSLPLHLRLPVHFSTLKWIGRSPAHYRYYMENPSEPSKSMRLGAAIDALVFEHKHVAVSPCATRRSKEWGSFVADNPGRIHITPSEESDALGMFNALRACKPAWELLNRGERQKTLTWQMNGRQCEGTPDLFSFDVLLDLKSGITSDPALVPWQVVKLGYHAQLDWYANAIAYHLGARPKRCVLVFVEQSPPYVVTIFEATEADLLKGRKLWRLWFERLLVCEANNSWPGYCESVVPLNLPDSEGITLQVEGEEVQVD